MSVGIVSVSSFTEHPKHIYPLMGQCANVTSNCPFLLLIRCIANFHLEINFFNSNRITGNPYASNLRYIICRVGNWVSEQASVII